MDTPTCFNAVFHTGVIFLYKKHNLKIINKNQNLNIFQKGVSTDKNHPVLQLYRYRMPREPCAFVVILSYYHTETILCVIQAVRARLSRRSRVARNGRYFRFLYSCAHANSRSADTRVRYV